MKCSQCAKNEAHLNCGLCRCALCRGCAEVCNEPDFTYLRGAPAGLAHGVFCDPCFNTEVSAQIEAFHTVMEKARDITVYMKEQGKETRLFKRKEKPILVEDCQDREETLMRLAFQAAQLGFNAIIDVELTAKKIFVQAYQTSRWRGVAIPVQLTIEQLKR